MDQSLARREALRIWRLVLIVQLAFLAMSFLALPRLGVAARVGAVLRAIPTLIIALLFLPPWLERFLGRSFLAVWLKSTPEKEQGRQSKYPGPASDLAIGPNPFRWHKRSRL